MEKAKFGDDFGQHSLNAEKKNAFPELLMRSKLSRGEEDFKKKKGEKIGLNLKAFQNLD